MFDEAGAYEVGFSPEAFRRRWRQAVGIPSAEYHGTPRLLVHAGAISQPPAEQAVMNSRPSRRECRSQPVGWSPHAVLPELGTARRFDGRSRVRRRSS
jgi:hypothetical protein